MNESTQARPPISGPSSNQFRNDLLRFVQPGDTLLCGMGRTPFVVKEIAGYSAPNREGYVNIFFRPENADTVVPSVLCDLPDDLADRLVAKWQAEQRKD